jgi:hypothetical protein
MKQFDNDRYGEERKRRSNPMSPLWSPAGLFMTAKPARSRWLHEAAWLISALSWMRLRS